MSAVIQHSSSINNSFISTTDHLPCDVIRSVWLVQTCNISIHKARFRLNHLLVGLQNGKPSSSELKYNVTKEIIELKEHIDKLRMEAISESKALKNQLITHKYFLGQELDQLKNITDHRKNNQLNSHSPDNDELRKQLEKYYRENPLKSQREATKEQEEYARIQKESKKSAKSAVPKKKKKTGLKLVFKVPGTKKKVEKPKAARIKQKQPKVKAPKIEEVPVEPEEDNNLYCFCRQKSFGDMIACDNEHSCPNGEWFHYKCVGLLNRVEALKYTTGAKKWFCSEHCRAVVENEKKKKRKRRW